MNYQRLIEFFFKKSNKAALPYHFTNIMPVKGGKPTEYPTEPSSSQLINSEYEIYENAMQWLEALKEATNGSDKDKMRRISFSAFHSTMLHLRQPVKDISTMLPLLNESINSPSVVYHCLNVISKLIAKLNPSQVPITTADQSVLLQSRCSGIILKDSRTA